MGGSPATGTREAGGGGALGLVVVVVQVGKEVGVLLPDQVELAEGEVVEDLGRPQEVSQGDGHLL